MTPRDQRISSFIELLGPVILLLPTIAQLVNVSSFLRQPNSVVFLFSVLPPLIQTNIVVFIGVFIFEIWSKVVFLTGTVWLIQTHIFLPGLLSMWASTLMSNPLTTVSQHIEYFKMLHVAVSQGNAMVGKRFLFVVVSAMSGFCVLLIFSSIKFHGRVDSDTYRFFISTAVIELGITQVLVYVNGSIYNMSVKYLKTIRKRVPTGRNGVEIFIRKVVQSLTHSGVPLGPLPYAKCEYASRNLYEICSNVVNLLIAFN